MPRHVAPIQIAVMAMPAIATWSRRSAPAAVPANALARSQSVSGRWHGQKRKPPAIQARPRALRPCPSAGRLNERVRRRATSTPRQRPSPQAVRDTPRSGDSSSSLQV